MKRSITQRRDAFIGTEIKYADMGTTSQDNPFILDIDNYNCFVFTDPNNQAGMAYVSISADAFKRLSDGDDIKIINMIGNNNSATIVFVSTIDGGIQLFVPSPSSGLPGYRTASYCKILDKFVGY